MRWMKFNPGFLTDEQLVSSFCVRKHEFESIIEMLGERDTASSRHRLVIGPRGSGKTTLLLRVAIEIKTNPLISEAFFPIVFAEESYDVTNAGDFWLEAVTRLADQVPTSYGGDEIGLTLSELRTIRDQKTLERQCLATLLEFADLQNKRLVLIVENLDMMFREMADEDAGWNMRQTLQTEPRILLLAAANSRFDDIDNPDRAFYDLFVTRELRPLSLEECAVLWERVSGQARPPETMRGLEILTGGNPRLLSIVARFGAEMSFRDLMADLYALIDDLTDYFKSHIEALPPQERQVYLALADFWEPATTREIADRVRLHTSKCSAHLLRLVNRGVVEVAGGGERRKLYCITQRLFNIYYLLRRSRTPNPLVQALIQFMDAYYSPAELQTLATRMISEASGLETEALSFHWDALAHLIRLPALAPHRRELISNLPLERDMHDKANLHYEMGHYQEAADVFAEIVRSFRHMDQPEVQESVVRALNGQAGSLYALNRPDEAITLCDQIFRTYGKNPRQEIRLLVAGALGNKARVLRRSGESEKALEVFADVVRFIGEPDTPEIRDVLARSLINRVQVLEDLGRLKEAITVWDELAKRFDDGSASSTPKEVVTAALGKANSLAKMGQLEDTVTACDEAISRILTGPADLYQLELAHSLVLKGASLAFLNREEEAITAMREVLEQFGPSEDPSFQAPVAAALFQLAESERAKANYEESIAMVTSALDRTDQENAAIQCHGYFARAHAQLGAGNIGLAEEDIETALSLLTRTNNLLWIAIKVLIDFASSNGVERIAMLIEQSPASEMLGPLLVALHLEQGQEIRVPKEIEKVAEDIRKAIHARRSEKRESGKRRD